MGEVTSLAGGLVMCLKSSWIVCQGCGAWAETYLLRNLRLQRVILLDPSTSTAYQLANLDDACLVPFVGMWTRLVLNTYVVASCKRW